MIPPRWASRYISKLERYLKTDLRYLISGGSFLTLGQVASAGIGLALTIAFANLVPPETFGTYRYMLAVYALLALTAIPGIDTAVIRSVSKGYDAAWRESMRAKVRWSLVGSLIAFCAGAYYYAVGSPIIGILFIICGLALPAMESLGLYGSLFNGKKMFLVWTTADTVTQAVSAAALIGTLFFTDNIVLVMLAYFVPYIICRGITTYLAIRYVPLNSVRDPELSGYSKELTLFQAITRGMASLDQIVLYHFLGSAQVAIFVLATAVPTRMQSIFRATGTLAFPRFANRTEQEIVQTLPRKMLLLGIGIAAGCVAYVLVAPLLFAYVFPEYLQSITYSQVAVFYTLSAVTYPFSSYLFTHMKMAANYAIAGIGFITKVLCLLLLVPLIGIWGAVVGLLANSVLTIAVSLWMIYRTQSLR